MSRCHPCFPPSSRMDCESANTNTQRCWHHLASVREQIFEPPGRLCQSVQPFSEKYNNTCTDLNDSSRTPDFPSKPLVSVAYCSAFPSVCKHAVSPFKDESLVTAYWAAKSWMWLTTATLDGASGASRVRLSIKFLTEELRDDCARACACMRMRTFTLHSFVSHDNCCNLPLWAIITSPHVWISGCSSLHPQINIISKLDIKLVLSW